MIELFDRCRKSIWVNPKHVVVVEYLDRPTILRCFLVDEDSPIQGMINVEVAITSRVCMSWQLEFEDTDEAEIVLSRILDATENLS